MRSVIDKFTIMVLVVAVVISAVALHDTHTIPKQVPASVVHQICYTDYLSHAQGTITELPLVQTGALCKYDVDQTWKAAR